MDEKTKLLVSLGAAIAADCPPSFRHFLEKKNAVGLTPKEIQEAVEIADQVRTRTRIIMQRGINDVLRKTERSIFCIANPLERCI